jgi:hypothetical protein
MSDAFKIELDAAETATRGAAERLGCDLRAMNIAALRARYGDRHPKEFKEWGWDNPAYAFAGFSDASPVELHKALECVIYQCSEGDIDTWPLYERCEAVARAIKARHRINRNGAAWERAAWGD